MSEKNPLRVLIVEDSEFDALMLVTVLRQGGYAPDFVRVETREAFLTALEDVTFEAVLSDYNMPDFSAPEALKILQASERDLPFIIISGGIGEDIAVAAMRAGAHDYLMKGHLARLAPAVERELREARIRSARRKAVEELRESELRYRMLWENSTDAVLLMDADSNILLANPAVYDVFGYRAEDMVGENLTVVLPERADAEQDGFVDIIHSKNLAEERLAHETVGVRRDSTQVAVEIAFNDLEHQGEKRYVAFVRDVTARKKTEAQLREHHEQFRVAREIQQSLFPRNAPAFPNFEIAGLSDAADATGGDYFDYLEMVDGSLGLVVADVTGHGVGPALLMAETRAYLRILASNRDDVGQIMTRANSALADDLDFERFITVLLVKLDSDSRSISYVNAGHPRGYIFRPDGTLRESLNRTGAPLGIRPDVPYRVATTEAMQPGETMILITDGVDEAASETDEFFGEERLFDIVAETGAKSAREILDAISQAVRAFTGNAPQLDDMTVVVAKAV
jgi:sigma-B regulation protein RsbU (phosphoserine phosphatase)